MGWYLRGIERTDLDPFRFMRVARMSAIGGASLAPVGALLTVLGMFPLSLALLGAGVFLLLFPKIMVGIRAGVVREQLNTEMPFLTVLLQLAFATKAPLDVIVDSMTRYVELPGLRALALAAWNNVRMLGLESMDAMRRAVEKLAPLKLVYRFSSLHTALRLGEDVVSRLSIYMDMDLAEFSSNMARRIDRLTSIMAALVVGISMLSVTAVIVARANPAMLIVMGGLVPAVMASVMSLVVSVPFTKIRVNPGHVGVAVAASAVTALNPPLPGLGEAGPLYGFAVALAGFLVLREREWGKDYERGFMDFIYTLFDQMKHTPSAYRAAELAAEHGEYGPFTKRVYGVLQALRLMDRRLEDAALRGLPPLMSAVMRIVFDINRLGNLPSGTVDQLQNFVLKLFEARDQLVKSLGIVRFLGVMGAVMVAFVNSSLLTLSGALTAVAGGGQTVEIPMSILYMSASLVSFGYWALFSKISFSLRSGLLYMGIVLLSFYVVSKIAPLLFGI